MDGKWRTYEVCELIANGKLVIGDGYRARNEELAAEGLPFARAGNIDDGFRFDEADRFPEKDIARVGNKISQQGDVVFTSKGTVGRFAFVRSTTPRFVYSPQLCFWRSLDANTIEPRFLYYWMRSREFFVQVRTVAGQTDMAEYVNLADQRRMHITLPMPDEQRRIGAMLGTLDDKIELNERMNKTLDKIGRTIFKHWFIDFEFPNEAGKPYRASGGEMVFNDDLESEIPKGWTAGSLGNFIKFAKGRKPKNVSRALIEGYEPQILIETLDGGTPLYACPEGMVRVSRLEPVMVMDGASSGRVEIGCEGLLGSTLSKIFSTTHYLSNLHLYYFLKNNEHDINANTTGTSIPHADKQKIEVYRLALPDRRIFQIFSDLVGQMILKIIANRNETNTLTQVRGSLLTKLMSGKIRAPIQVS
jgi:type I restriction enzyme S subunit